MRGDDADTMIRQTFRSGNKRKQGTAVLGHEVFASALYLPDVGFAEPAESASRKNVGHKVDREKITCRTVHPVKQP